MTDNLSVAQAAKRLDVFPSTIVRWINAGLFPGAYKLNPHSANSPYRIPESAIKSFCAARRRHHPVIQEK